MNAPTSSRTRLHQKTGLSHYRNQDVGPALDHFEQARTLYKAVADTAGLAQALIWLVRARITHASVPMGILAPDVKELETVLDTLGTSDPGLHSHILTVLAQAYRHARQSDRGAELARHALVIGLQVNDHRLCAQAGESLRITQLGRLQVESAIASWQESLGYARAARDVMLQRLALTNLPHALNLQGSLDDGETLALEGHRLTKSLQDWALHTKALSHLASIAVAKGNFSAAERYTRDTMAMLERSRYAWGGFRAMGAFACAATLCGLWSEANQTLDALIEPGRVFTTPDRIIRVFTRVFRQLILGYQGERLTEYIAPLHDELMEVVTYDTYPLAPLCAMIELGYLTLMPQFAERPAAMLEHAMAQGVIFSSGWCFLIPRTLGLAAMMHEDWEQAEKHLQHAISIATDVQALPELGRAYLNYADMLHTNPKTEDYVAIEAPLQQARRIFYMCNMIPFARHTSQLINKLFPEHDVEDDDRHGQESNDGEEPPEPSPFSNGTKSPD